MLNIILGIFLLTGSPNSLLIGDSQAISIQNNSKLVTVDQTLQKVGWRVSDLIKALIIHTVDEKAKKVFITIGTNGTYDAKDDVDFLCKLLKTKFPNADLYVIVGSYGWGNNKTVSKNLVNEYYKRFEKAGILKLKNEIGFSSTHPSVKTPSIIEVAREIDSIINGE